MAIKSRKAVDPAAIEAFGDAADSPANVGPAPEPASAAPTAPGADTTAVRRAPGRARTTPTRAVERGWPVGVAKTVTLRYSDPELPELLAEIAALDDRSQHNTALRALRRGLDELKREVGTA